MHPLHLCSVHREVCERPSMQIGVFPDTYLTKPATWRTCSVSSPHFRRPKWFCTLLPFAEKRAVPSRLFAPFRALSSTHAQPTMRAMLCAGAGWRDAKITGHGLVRRIACQVGFPSGKRHFRRCKTRCGVSFYCVSCSRAYAAIETQPFQFGIAPFRSLSLPFAPWSLVCRFF